MRVTFVLPAPVRVPMGGAAVVYRHAAGLAARGHEVRVVAPRRGAGGIAAHVRAAAVRIRDRLHGLPDAPFYDASGVTTVEVDAVGEGSFPSGEAVIATGHQTIPWVESLRDRCGQKVYFLQGDERALDASAGATWARPFARIAVSQWLAATVEAAGHPVIGVVPNAVDPAAFALDRPLAGRDARVVALYHRHPVKGPETLARALGDLRRLRPDVQADVVAARPPSHRLPEYVRVHVRPDALALRALYNRASVALHTSRLEGWGLVPMEAAACGCAVVATASRGVAEFLRAGVSMREVPVGDAHALAEGAADLLADPPARIALAAAGMADVARFSWDASTAEFERLLLATQR